VKVSWSRWQLGHEFIGAGLVVQVNSQDFGWLTWGKMDGILDGNFSAICSNQFIANSKHLNRCPF
jgi:hypothetical protein